MIKLLEKKHQYSHGKSIIIGFAGVFGLICLGSRVTPQENYVNAIKEPAVVETQQVQQDSNSQSGLYR